MIHIKRIDEVCGSLNESEMSSSRYEERKFEKKLFNTLNRNVLAYGDDIKRTLDLTYSMSQSELAKFSTNDMHIESRGKVLYIDFQKYTDKHILMSVYNEGGNKYLTLTAEVNTNTPQHSGNTSHSTIFFDYDLSSDYVVYELSDYFKCRYGFYDGVKKVVVYLEDDYQHKTDTMDGDELFSLVSEFGKKFGVFIKQIKNDLGIGDVNEAYTNHDDYLNREVYFVEDYNGKKRVRVNYYFFDDGGGKIQFVGFIGCHIDIPATDQDIELAEENCKQFQEDVSIRSYENQCRNVLDKYKRLPISKVTNSTPEGTYINM